MKILKGIILIASLIITIKANVASVKIEEIEEITEDIVEYGSADCIARDVNYNDRSNLDVYYDPNNTNDKKPVVIQFHGGSWFNEDKINCVSSALLLHEKNYVTVVPNFVLYPAAQIDDIVSDFYDSIKWTFDNIDQYGGDSSNITVVGQSSSAHLLILTILKASLVRKNNNVSLAPLPEIKRAVLINGPYEYNESLLQTVTNESIEASKNFLKEVSLAVLGIKDNCPVDLLKDYGDNSVSSFNVEKFNIIYSSLDVDIAETSANSLMEEMKRVCPSVNIQYIFLEGLDHDGVPNGIREKNESIRNAFIQMISI
ncbi:alpha/beta-hydrolase [Neocallimastix lanati (nom. inval.)]|jgi:transcription termination factor NusB|uniref:Alpha/beta-hydrolase n=1 Tax=Neocallimastix californiae TaxID=1754190 RepID=A0A1Y1YCZ0_9FUNG|nr:alpha/beta-hydrolase [Neocallimastix sp. JGI-2020a]ORX95805.1 alpha/beta-hydrolase [Neocallimastix californiae]|eukprot:ORX95805.1 alpha/beta-hydrolase [Neocallimastix californiae]